MCSEEDEMLVVGRELTGKIWTILLLKWNPRKYWGYYLLLPKSCLQGRGQNFRISLCNCSFEVACQVGTLLRWFNHS